MEGYILEIYNRLKKEKKRYDELAFLISAPEIIADNRYWRHLVFEQANIKYIHDLFMKIENLIFEIELLNEEIKKTTIHNKAKLNLEISNKENDLKNLIQDGKILLIQKNTIEYKDAVIEIYPQENSEENEIFAFDIYTMYENFLIENNYKIKKENVEINGKSKLKNAKFIIKESNAFRKFKFENGIHKAVNFNKKTNTNNNVLNVIVIVYPSLENTEKNIKENDIKIDVFHSSGAGGQNVNKVESAIRATHIESGIVVTCQDERSQLKNKERAIKILKEKVKEFYKNDIIETYAKMKTERKNFALQNEKIRSYNYKQNIACDLRFDVTQALEKTLKGDINIFLDTAILWLENE